MKKIYFTLLSLLIGSTLFAQGWVQDFSTEVTSTIDESQTAIDDAAWYFTGVTTTHPLFGTKTTLSAWKNSSSNWTAPIKPATKFAYFNGTLNPTAVGNASEFSLVSPTFTPTAEASILYYKIQEITWNTVTGKPGEGLYLDIATKEGDEWVWANGTTNLLADLIGHNTATTPIVVKSTDLSANIGTAIKIRFRGILDTGNSVAVIHSIALVGISYDLTIATAQNIIPQIPLKHANQVLNASVTNLGAAVTQAQATVNVTATDYSQSVGVPALDPLASGALAFGTAFEPQLFGNYSVQYAINFADDNNAANNTATSNAFAITPNVFATDKGFLSNTASNKTAILGNKFTLTVNDNIESVSVAWGKVSTTPTDQTFTIVIYKVEANGSLVETPVYTSGTLTRPDNNVDYPNNNRDATFINYPVGQALEAGTYIFGISTPDNIGVGTEYDYDRGLYYSIAKSDLTLSTTASNNLLVRVHTASDIILTPGLSDKGVTLNAPIVISGTAISSLVSSHGITVNKVVGTTKTPIDIVAAYADNAITITHATAFEVASTYEVNVPAAATNYGKELTWSFTTIPSLAVAGSYTPGSGASNIALNSPVKATFNRAIPLSSSLAGISIVTVPTEGAGVPVENVSGSIDGITLNIAHDNFVNSVKYKVTIPATALAEYTGNDITWQFTAVPPLAVSQYYPVDNAGVSADVAEGDFRSNNGIRVVFNQAITGSTLAGITVNDIPVTGTLTNTDTRISIDVSDVPFTNNTPYTVVIPAASVAGYSGADITWTFTSFNPLTPVAWLPAKDAPEVPVDAEISVEFNKPIFKAGFNPPIVTIKAGDVLIGGVTYAVDTQNNKKLVIGHTEALQPETTYTVTIPAGSAAAYQQEITWSFTTAVPLSVLESGYTPAKNAENVPVTNAINVTFNKAIELTSTTAAINGITLNGDNSLITTIALVSSNKQLQIRHTALANETEYTVFIPASAIVGYSGPDITWSFITVPALTFTLSPDRNATNVSLDASVSIAFSRPPLRSRAASLPSIKDAENQEVAVTVAWNGTYDEVTFNHAEPFALETVYTVTIPSGTLVEATEYGPITWSFTTTNGLDVKKVDAPLNRVYPAITKGNLTVVAEQGSKVKVVDITGKTLATYQSTGSQFDIHLNYSNGLYIVVVENGKSTSAFKVVLQK